MRNSGQRNFPLSKTVDPKIYDEIKNDKNNITFKDLSIAFYTNRMAYILKSYKRGNLIGILLLLVYYFQIMSLLFEEKVVKHLSDGDQEALGVLKFISQILRCCRIYAIWDITLEKGDESSNKSMLTKIQIVFSTVAINFNMLILFYIFVQYVFWMISQNYKPLCKKHEDIHENIVIDMIKKKYQLNHNSLMKNFFSPNGSLNLLISFLLQTYRYVVTIPLCLASLNLIYSEQFQFQEYIPQGVQYLLGISLFITTSFINLLIIVNEFDYSIRYRDCFGSRVNYFQWVNIFLDITLSFQSTQIQSLDPYLHIWLHLFSASIRIGFLVFEFPFYFLPAQYSHFFGLFVYFFTAAFGPISLTLFDKSSYFMSTMFAIPISIKLGCQTLQWRESLYSDVLNEEDIKDISAYHFDYYIRQAIIPLCSLDIEQYLNRNKNGYGIRFETLYSEHIINCQNSTRIDKNEGSPQKIQKQNASKIHDCFCQKYQQAEHNLNNMNGHLLRKQFIIEYIYHLFQIFFINTGGKRNITSGSVRDNSPQKLKYYNQIKPVYLYYLIQIALTPAKAYTEVFVMKQKIHSMPIQKQYLMEQILEDLDKEFIQFFEQSNFQNQRLRIGDVYQFDHVCRDAYRVLNKGLRSKSDFFQFLNQDQISLKKLINISQETLSTSQVIEETIIKLFRMNPLHPRSLSLATTFINFFDFKRRSLTSFILKAANLNETEFPQNIRNESAKMDMKINLFHSKSAAFFICLQNNSISRVSDSSSKLFGCNTADLIGKPLSLLFPDCYYPHISSYIENLIEEANIDLIKIGIYHTFIRTSRESILPVSMRLKLDFLDEQTFGLSCYMQRVESDKHYIICDSQFNFLEASNQIKQLLFKHLYSKLKKKNPEDVLQRISVRNFIPLLYGIEKFQQINEFDTNQKASSAQDRSTNFNQFTSILFLPTSVSQLNILQKEVKQEIYDVNKYFRDFPISQFDLVQITFSPLLQKSYNDRQKKLHIIQITKLRKFKKIHEINEQIEQIKERYLKYFLHPVEIQLYENLNKQTSHVQEIQTYVTQETQLKIPNDQTYRNESGEQNKVEGSGLQGIDQFESNAFQQSKKDKGKYTEQISLNLSSKKSSRYSDSNSSSNSIQVQREVSQKRKELEESVQKQKSIENEIISYNWDECYNYNYFDEYQMIEAVDQYDQNIDYNEQNVEMNNQNMSQDQQYMSMNIFQETPNLIDQQEGQHDQTEKFVVIHSPKSNSNYDLSVMQSHIQFINSPRFGQELQSPLSSNKDNEQSQRYFIKNANNNSESLSQVIYGSMISPGVKNNQIMQDSTIDDKHSNQYQLPLPAFRNNEKLPKIQDSSLYQYTMSHTSIEQEIKNNIQTNNKVKVSRFSIHHQLSRKEIQQLEKNVTKLYEAQNSKKQIKDHHSQKGEGKDEQSYNQRHSDKGHQASERDGSKFKKKNDSQGNEELNKSIDSHVYSKKQFLYDMIDKRQEPVQIKYARNVGIFALILLISITISLYVSLVSYFDNGWDYFSKMVIGVDILECYSQVVRQKELLVAKQYDYLHQFFLSDKNLPSQIKNESYYRQLQLIQLLHNFETEGIKKGFEKYMLEEEIVVPFIKYERTPIEKNYQRLYALLSMPTYLKVYSSGTDLDALRYVLQNYQNMVDMLTTIVSQSSDRSNEKINGSQNLLYLSIALLETFSGLVLILIFPIYYIIQNKSEEILKLMVTFDSTFLNRKIAKYNHQIQNQQGVSTSKTLRSLKTFKNLETKNIISLSHIGLDPTSNSHTKNADKKRKVVSQIDRLQRFSLQLTFHSIAVFMIISTYSIANFTLTRNFFNTFKYNIEELSNVYELKSLLSLEYTTLSLLSSSSFYKFSHEEIQILQTFKEKFIDQQLLEKTSYLYKIEENFQQERQKMETYKEVLLKTIKTDACEILEERYDNTQKTSDEYKQQQIDQYVDEKVNVTNCQYIMKGKLKQGLIVSLKDLFQQFNSILYIFNQNIEDQFNFWQVLDVWSKENNFYEIQQSYYYIRQIIRLLKEESHKSGKDYFDYIKNIQFILCLYFIFTIFFIFIFLWQKFVNELRMKIFKVRYFLTLIPLENLLENPYIMSYLTKQIRYKHK